MRARSIILLGISLVLAFVVIQWVRGLRNEPVPVADTSPTIVVTAAPLNFGDHISAANLRLMKWPGEATPQGAFTKIEDLAGPNENRVVLRTMETGEPVLASKVSGSGGRATLSTIIGETMRAVTIRVTDATGVAGFVLPGDRVDVLLTRGTQGGNQDRQETNVLLQNVKVLGIDQEASESRDKPAVVKAVTLEVSPEDAQKLTLAGGVGVLSLTLRNLADPQPIATRTLSLSDLVPTPPKVPEGFAPPPPPRPRVARAAQIEILRGTQATSYSVRPDGSVAAGLPPEAAQPPATQPPPSQGGAAGRPDKPAAAAAGFIKNPAF